MEVGLQESLGALVHVPVVLSLLSDLFTFRSRINAVSGHTKLITSRPSDEWQQGSAPSSELSAGRERILESTDRLPRLRRVQ